MYKINQTPCPPTLSSILGEEKESSRAIYVLRTQTFSTSETPVLHLVHINKLKWAKILVLLMMTS